MYENRTAANQIYKYSLIEVAVIKQNFHYLCFSFSFKTKPYGGGRSEMNMRDVHKSGTNGGESSWFERGREKTVLTREMITFPISISISHYH
jgi:hypothetical protein